MQAWRLRLLFRGWEQPALSWCSIAWHFKYRHCALCVTRVGSFQESFWLGEILNQRWLLVHGISMYRVSYFTSQGIFKNKHGNAYLYEHTQKLIWFPILVCNNCWHFSGLFLLRTNITNEAIMRRRLFHLNKVNCGPEYLKTWNLGQQDSSAAKGIYCQGWWPQFNLWNPFGVKWEAILGHCLLSCRDIHTHTYTQTQMIFRSINKPIIKNDTFCYSHLVL